MTSDEFERRTIIVAVPDLNGVLRGKALTVDAFDGRPDDFVALTDQVFAVDPTDEPIPGLKHGSDRGAPNAFMRPDMETMRPVPWAPGWHLCLANAFRNPDEVLAVAPRTVLQTVLGRAQERGMRVLAGFEYEFRLTREGLPAGYGTGMSYSAHEVAGLHGFVDQLVESGIAMGLDIGALHTEGGRGLVEVNLSPAEGLEAADQAAVLKWAVGQVATRRDLRSSFLAKTEPEEEGSSGHLHVSVTTANGRPLLRREPDGAPSLSPDTRASIAGMLGHMDAASLLYNPNVNSYKRLVPGSFAPVNATWGFDNRTAAVRVLPSGQEGLRLENRRPGADANPYLVLAGSVASMLLGLDEDQDRLLAAPAEADASSRPGVGALPASLEAALTAFDNNDPFRQSLGKEFSDHFTATRRWELAAWQRAVTGWERDRYRNVT